MLSELTNIRGILLNELVSRSNCNVGENFSYVSNAFIFSNKIVFSVPAYGQFNGVRIYVHFICFHIKSQH